MEVLHKDFWTDKNEAQFRKMIKRKNRLGHMASYLSTRGSFEVI